jgi:lipoprotein-anchoring transpeptidase ErfK/SrfK
VRRIFAAAAVAAFVFGVSPALATDDSSTEQAVGTPADIAPLPSIAPNISETRRFAPRLPRNSGDGRRVVYSNSLQWVWVVDKNEEVVRSMPVSGRRGVPAPGTYKVTTKSLWSFSLDFEGVNFRWMTRFATGPEGGNIGFHEIPRKDGKALQTEAQLGSFAGSGCVRMATQDVKFIYRWAQPGTAVVVLR